MIIRSIARPFLRRALPSLCASLALSSFATPADADQGLLPYVVATPRLDEADALTLAVFELVRFDSNSFRLPDGVDPPDSTHRSTMTYTSGVGLALDKTYGLQRFFVNASVARDHYSRFSNLDYTSQRWTATYDWKLTPSISGELSHDDNRAPTDYEYTGYLTRPNLRRTQRTAFDVELFADAPLRPRLSVFRSVDRTTTPTFQVGSSESNGGEAALLYSFRSGNSADVYARAARGKDLNADADAALLINPEFNEHELGVRGAWNYPGLTKGNAQFGYLQHRYDTFSVRDFSGFVGRLKASYELTGKTTFDLEASRSLYSAQTPFSSYYIEELATASIGWQLTGKITIRPSFSYRHQQYEGSPFDVARPLVETVRYGYLQVDWAALRSLDFSLQVGRSSRQSSEPTLQFVDRTAAAFARFKF